MIVENTELFQAWLTKILKPLYAKSDADSAALAKYVLALIKKDKSEKDLRQSMSDQLDVFLQAETKPFVTKLFEALKTKEYLNHKMDTSPSKNETSSAGPANNMEGKGELSLKGEKFTASSSETEPSSSTSASGPSQTSITSSTSSPEDVKKGLVTLSVVPSALLSSSETTSSAPNSQESLSKEDSRPRRDRREDDRERRRKRSRMERDGRRISRSRSGERNKRSRSPRINRDRSDRLRHRPRKSPPMRRYDRDAWDRRRSRSPIRNRSASPRNRSRSPPPPRYRRPPFNSSRSRSRSPLMRDNRSRSPRSRSHSPNKDRKESMLPIPPVSSTHDSDLSSSPEKPLVQSVVVRPSTSQTLSDSPDQKYNNSQGSTTSSGNRCRDFDEKGLCMRGELCPYDHGHDPVVLEDVLMPGSGGPGYPPRGIPGGPGYAGEYYPDNPALEQPGPWGPPGNPQFRPRHINFDQMPRGRGGIILRPGMGPGYPGPGGPGRQLISVPVVGGGPPVSVMGDLRGPHPPMPPMAMHHHAMRGMHLMRGRGRGAFDHGRLGAKPPRNYTNCSLEVRKIPREQNSIMDLNSHFLRFGKIINIQINYDNDPEAALVTFSSPAEAHLAYRSTEAVLNNRFIRVFWHNKEKENEEEADSQPLSGSPGGRISVKERLGVQPESTEHDKIVISGNTITKTVYNNAAIQNRKVETSKEKLQAVEQIKKSQEMLAAQISLKNLQEQRKQEALKMSNDLRRKQQTMMEDLIAQQKKLIAKIESGALKPEEKEETLKLIKLLQDKVTKLKKDLDETSLRVGKNKGVVPVPQSKEEAQKEVLDAELDLYNREQEGGDTNELQMKVIELRARAKTLGLLGGRGRGYRGGGRGFRGRGIIRGRGRGIVRALRSVDRRPTKIRVTGFPVSRMSVLLTHFSVFGPIRDYTSNPAIPELVVDFDSRKCAEVAMVNGQQFEGLVLIMEWVVDNVQEKARTVESGKDGDASNTDDLDTTGSLLDEDEEDELGDILSSEILLTAEEDEDDDDDRSWRR